jgi:hypothetical protein
MVRLADGGEALTEGWAECGRANAGPGSDYFVLWPCKELSCAVMVGDDMVVDAYDKGQLWRRSEMLEMFEIEEFVPASSHEARPSETTTPMTRI